MANDPDGCISFALLSVCVSGVLAMIATWFLVARFPIPDDDAIYGGLLGFLFVVFLDAFLIYGLILPEFRKGRRMEATRWLVGLILAGLLAATVVGAFPWFTSRFIPDGPWLDWILWSLLVLSFAPDILRIWKRWRSRRASP